MRVKFEHALKKNLANTNSNGHKHFIVPICMIAEAIPIASSHVQSPQ